MGKKFVLSLVTAALVASIAAHAEIPENPMDHMGHQQHMAGNDSRQLVDFPPDMRQHTLANMRDHLEALSEILGAMSAAQYAKASQIAKARLGMDSPSAAGCKAEAVTGAPQLSKPANMDHQMAEFMPEAMRSIGLSMHQAASDFATEAAKAGKTGNPKPALTALSKVTQQCSACHASYRVQ